MEVHLIVTDGIARSVMDGIYETNAASLELQIGGRRAGRAAGKCALGVCY